MIRKFTEKEMQEKKLEAIRKLAEWVERNQEALKKEQAEHKGKPSK